MLKTSQPLFAALGKLLTVLNEIVMGQVVLILMQEVSYLSSVKGAGTGLNVFDWYPIPMS